MSELFRFTLARPTEPASGAIQVGPGFKGKTLSEIRADFPKHLDDVVLDSVFARLKGGALVEEFNRRLPAALSDDRKVKGLVQEVFKYTDLQGAIEDSWQHDEEVLDRAIIELYLRGRDRYATGPKLARIRQVYDLLKDVLPFLKEHASIAEGSSSFVLKPLVFSFVPPVQPYEESTGEPYRPKSTDSVANNARVANLTEILDVLNSTLIHRAIFMDGPKRVPRLTKASWELSLSEQARALADGIFFFTDGLEVMHATAIRVLQRELSKSEAGAYKFSPIGNIGVGGTNIPNPWRAEDNDMKEVPWVPAAVPSPVKPSGVGNLLVVRSHTLRYEGGEIFNIENVLKGETMVHEVKKLDRTEVAIVTTESEEKEEMRDTSSSDRFSISDEASNVIKEDSELKTGLSLSGKYGTLVEYKADMSYSEHESQEQSTKVASEFAKDVTSRAASRVVHKASKSKSLLTIEERQDNITHTFANGGGEHTSGIYQWVNKVVQSQIYDYGMRILFDLVIPEPAAFLLEAMSSSAEAIVRPPELMVSAKDINEANYATLAAVYGASGVTAPPSFFYDFSVSFSAEPKGGSAEQNGSPRGLIMYQKDIDIEPKYAAIAATVVLNFAFSHFGTTDNVSWVEVTCSVGETEIKGKREYKQEDPDKSWQLTEHFDMTRPFSQKKVGFAITLAQTVGVSGTIRLHCIRTPEALRDWQHTTYDSLAASHGIAMAEYERKIADAALNASPRYNKDFNPDMAKNLVKDELKKACISLLTSQTFTVFDSLQRDTNFDVVEVNQAKAMVQGRYIQFFEQVFEWDQLQYALYPYYWARKSSWKDRLFQSSTDADFADFCRAGAARVHFGSAKNFGLDVLYFLQTGKVWGGGPTPAIVSEDYLSIAEELAKAQERTGDEVPSGEPWETRVPTALVKLRDEKADWTWEQNGPVWEKDPLTGYWREVH